MVQVVHSSLMQINFTVNLQSFEITTSVILVSTADEDYIAISINLSPVSLLFITFGLS